MSRNQPLGLGTQLGTQTATRRAARKCRNPTYNADYRYGSDGGQTLSWHRIEIRT
jgi:hypothetical protein